MEISVLSFGQITDIVGSSEIKLTGVNSTEELIRRLVSMFPELVSLNYSVAINHKVIQANTVLHEDDVVALLPPFSGG